MWAGRHGGLGFLIIGKKGEHTTLPVASPARSNFDSELLNFQLASVFSNFCHWPSSSTNAPVGMVELESMTVPVCRQRAIRWPAKS